MAAPSWQELLTRAAGRLADAGVSAADHDARALLAHHLGCPLGQLHQWLSSPVRDQNAYQALLERRAAREPLAHITGTRGFWSLDLKITADVLDPRPDTETLIEAVLKHCPDKSRPLQLLEIGTGSGAIALSLLSELPKAAAVATDISPKALAVAQENAAAHGLEKRLTLVETSWATGVKGPFDIIVSNPPYIETRVIDALEEEVKRYEPHLALDGGADGLAAYRAILQQVQCLLKPEGLIAFEIGYDQAERVIALMANTDMKGLQCHKDLAGKNRAITGFFKD